jgi:hypothetical protein
MVPNIGMTFNGLESAKEFYESYALRVGFSVRIGQHKKVDGVVLYKLFLCANEGFWEDKGERGLESGSEKRSYEKRITRCGCEAKLVIKLVDGDKYVITGFEQGHTHAFVSPDKRHLIRSNRKLTLSGRNTLLTCHKASIGTSQAYRYLRVGVGGFENVGFTKRDLQNYHSALRVLIKSSDALMFVDQLSRKSLANPGFYFDYVVDDKGRLIHVFWADAICRKNYAHFGDLVSFDSTYSTNEYGMVFTPFTGVNHHKSSVLFGATMLSDETMESYMWLFHTFLKAMGGVAPKLIITDEAASMKAAIREVLTTTIHRLCMWHILMKVCEKVGPILKEDEKFKARLSSCVWSSETPLEFEDEWSCIIYEYGLEDNEWFSTKFDQRRSWVPAYFSDIPLLGLLRTTSRSESADSFFSRLIGWKLALVEFWLRLDAALEEQRHKELEEDNITLHTIRNLKTEWVIEKHASEFFTLGVGIFRPNRRTEPKRPRPRPKRPRPRNSVIYSVPALKRPNLFRLLGSVNRINRNDRNFGPIDLGSPISPLKQTLEVILTLLPVQPPPPAPPRRRLLLQPPPHRRLLQPPPRRRRRLCPPPRCRRLRPPLRRGPPPPSTVRPPPPSSTAPRPPPSTARSKFFRSKLSSKISVRPRPKKPRPNLPVLSFFG